MRAHQLGLKFHLATHNGVLTSIADMADASEASVELRNDAVVLAEALAAIDVERTQCSKEADKAKIMASVYVAVGKPQFNLAIRGLLAEVAWNVCMFTERGDLRSKCIFMVQDAKMVAWANRTPLHIGAVESVEAIEAVNVTSTEELNAKDSKGNTALMLAARFNQLEIVHKLAALDADVAAADNDGYTARASYMKYVLSEPELSNANPNLNPMLSRVAIQLRTKKERGSQGTAVY